MKPEQFCYWLQGLLEVGNPKTLNEKQIQIIKNHLNLVFYLEIDKSYDFNQKQMDEAQKIHDGKWVEPNKTGVNPLSPYSKVDINTSGYQIHPGKIMLRC